MRQASLWMFLGAALALGVGCDGAGDDDDGAMDDDDATDDDDSAGDDDDSAGDDDDSAAGPWDQGWPIQVPVDGQALIEGSWEDSGPVWWVLDTGAARTYADSALTGEDSFATGDLVIGPLSFPDTQVSCTDLAEAEAFIGWDLAGLAGQDVFRDRFIAIDYRRQLAFFADEIPVEAPPGSGEGTAASTAYDLPSGIPVGTFTLEGATTRDAALIADTGSGVTLLLEEVFDDIDDGTLPRLEGYVWGTNYGTDDAFVTRLPAIVAGDGSPRVRVEGSWAVVIPTDNHLWPLLEGAGIVADGFLGYPFYREQIVGVDGWNDRYAWWPQEQLDHLDPGEWNRVGIEPSWRDGAFWVEMVFDPSDAWDQGVQVGDEIVAVDGLDMATATADDVKRALRGQVGDTVGLSLLRDGQEMALTLEIRDLLPAI